MCVWVGGGFRTIAQQQVKKQHKPQQNKENDACPACYYKACWNAGIVPKLLQF